MNEEIEQLLDAILKLNDKARIEAAILYQNDEMAEIITQERELITKLADKLGYFNF